MNVTPDVDQHRQQPAAEAGGNTPDGIRFQVRTRTYCGDVTIRRS